MNIRIVFFDGGGTLWYPQATLRTKAPWWVYEDETTKDRYLDHLILTPQAVETLTSLRNLGIKTVILSTHPHEPAVAAGVLNEKVTHFSLTSLFDEIHATATYHAAKGEKMMEILERLNIPKDEALMVGDSYRWDYQTAEEFGVKGMLVNSEYHQTAKNEEPAERVINDLDELLGLISG